MPEFVQLSRAGDACVLTLTREEKLNAISTEVEAELCAALEQPSLRDAACVVITGGPRVFSAGADLNEMRGLDPAAIVSYYRATGDFAERVANLAQPTFSVICGYCLGGGLELALATDFRIAEEGAVLGLPEVGLGILPSSGGTQRLVRMLGPARAKELILLRDRIDAAEGLRLGVLTEVVAAGAGRARALEHAERLAGLPRLAVQLTGQVIDAVADAPRSAGIELERLAYALLAQTSEADAATAGRLAR